MNAEEIGAVLRAGAEDRAAQRGEMEDNITAIIKDVCEIDWHGSSPDDKPSLLAVTVEELTLILRRHLLGEE